MFRSHGHIPGRKGFGAGAQGWWNLALLGPNMAMVGTPRLSNTYMGPLSLVKARAQRPAAAMNSPMESFPAATMYLFDFITLTAFSMRGISEGTPKKTGISPFFANGQPLVRIFLQASSFLPWSFPRKNLPACHPAECPGIHKMPGPSCPIPEK